jgi:hypothetical protein
VNVAEDAPDQLAARAALGPPDAQRLKIAEQDFEQIFGLGQKFAQNLIAHGKIVTSDGGRGVEK